MKFADNSLLETLKFNLYLTEKYGDVGIRTIYNKCWNCEKQLCLLCCCKI